MWNPICKHDWEILSEKTTESRVEHFGNITKKMYLPKALYHYEFMEMTERKLIQLVQCKKCGKLKKFTEKF